MEAWKKFEEKFPEYHLVIAGTPERKDFFRKLVALKENTKNVEIRTSVSDTEVKKLVAGCVAGIFLGYQEDFGIMPLEILSAEKPLIAVDEGGYVDFIKNHPLFHKIKERHNREEMIEEVAKELENFAKMKLPKNPGKSMEIKVKDFALEIDKVLRKEYLAK